MGPPTTKGTAKRTARPKDMRTGRCAPQPGDRIEPQPERKSELARFLLESSWRVTRCWGRRGGEPRLKTARGTTELEPKWLWFPIAAKDKEAGSRRIKPLCPTLGRIGNLSKPDPKGLLVRAGKCKRVEEKPQGDKGAFTRKSKDKEKRETGFANRFRLKGQGRKDGQPTGELDARAPCAPWGEFQRPQRPAGRAIPR